MIEWGDGGGQSVAYGNIDGVIMWIFFFLFCIYKYLPTSSYLGTAQEAWEGMA